MRCRACDGWSIGYISNRCSRCNNSGEEPFDAEAEIAELKRRVEALEKPKETPATKHRAVWRLMRDSNQGINLNRYERKELTDYILALKKECGK